MIDLTPTYTDDVVALILSERELVYAEDIAPIVRMHPDVIRKKARDGTWPREICNYIVNGRTVKFFKVDFLRKGGWIQ